MDNGVLQRIAKELGAISQVLNISAISLWVLKLGYFCSSHWISLSLPLMSVLSAVITACNLLSHANFNAPGSRIIKVMHC